MRRAYIYMHGVPAAVLEETKLNKEYRFQYLDEYEGPPVSLTIPVNRTVYLYDCFPPFFDGLLPEGDMLEGLLRQSKIDRNDLFGQLTAVGREMVGAVTVKEME